jgi:hypothetical protein
LAGGEFLGNADTQERAAVEIAPYNPAAASAPAEPPVDNLNIDVDMGESPFQPVAPVGPMVPTLSKANQPAATVMFESPVVPVETSPSKVERFAPEPEAGDSEPSADGSEPEPPTAGTRRTPTKASFKSKVSQKKGFKSRSGTPSKWSTAEDDSTKPTKSSSGKTPIIVVAAVALVAVIGVAVYFMRGSAKTEQPVKEPVAAAPSAAEPAPSKAEPAPSEQPAALAAKPAEAEPTPAAAAEKPKLAEPEEKPAHAEKPAPAEKPAHAEKTGHAEKAPPAEKPKAEPAQPEAKSPTGKPSEDDYRRASEAYERGNAKLFQGSAAEAIAEFTHALKLNPKDPAIHRGLGLAFAQSGKSAEAVKHLKLYLKASPKATDRSIIEKRIDQLRGQ